MVVGRVRNPGITSIMKGYAFFTNGEPAKYQVAGWSTSKMKANITDSEGNFTACIPLKTLLGFCEDFKKFLSRSTLI